MNGPELFRISIRLQSGRVVQIPFYVGDEIATLSNSFARDFQLGPGGAAEIRNALESKFHEYTR